MPRVKRERGLPAVRGRERQGRELEQTQTQDSQEMWTLSADRRRVRLNLPSFTVTGLPKPLQMNFDFDAKAMDAILQRLTRLRVQMEPPPQRH
jgi:hypothetical protein